MTLILFWIALCALVGLLAMKYNRSALGYFLLALIVSPIIGALVLLIIGKYEPEDGYVKPFEEMNAVEKFWHKPDENHLIIYVLSVSAVLFILIQFI